MRRYLFIIILFSFTYCSPFEEEKEQESSVEETIDQSENYNEALAKELQADDYGMHQYVMAFLKAGPNRDLPEEEAKQLQSDHLENISKMAEEGHLVLAGPFLDDGDVRGIYIFDVDTVEEAEELTNSDPAVQAGSLVMELKPWYGSAALMKVNEIHSQIAKENP